MNTPNRLDVVALAAFIGLAVGTARADTLIPTNAVWKYFLGTNEPVSGDLAAWRQIDFDDSAWASGGAPIGYASPPNDPGGFEARIATSLRPSSSVPPYSSVYLRKSFAVGDPSLFTGVSVTASYDDGVVVWINGVEIGRNRVPSGDLAFNATATSQAETITTTFRATSPGAGLRAGTNVVAVHLLNGSRASLDLFFEASLASSVDDEPPILVNRLPPPHSTLLQLLQVEVFFHELVTNVDAGDLLINGAAATNVLDINGSQFLFQFPAPATGTVQVAFAQDHGITDVSPLRNPFAGASWSYVLDPNTPLTGIVISEFMADNETGLRDEDGDTSDWIELFNGNRVAVNLEGWYLTDTPLNLTKWRMPNVGIAESDYLVLFASAKNRTHSTSSLHTNFRLSKNAGSYLALVDPTGTKVVSAFVSYPAQAADTSYGRDRNDPSLVGYYAAPTPRAANTIAGAGFAADVLFSKAGSTFVSPFMLSLATPDTNTVIRYFLVTNAVTAAATNVPNLNSPLYTSPIQISGPTIVRARAFSTGPGVFPGKIRSETYLRLSSNVLNFSSDLPLIIIHNFGAGPYPTSQAEFLAAFAVFDPGYDRASLTNTPVLMTRAGVNLRGYSTLTYPKSSFAVEFKNEFNDEENLSLLEMPEESDWVLYAPNDIEPVLFHNPLYYRLSREIGRYASRTRFAEVFVNTAGGAVGTNHYNGIYVVAEKPKRAPGRVDLARLDAEDTNAPAITGGYLLASDWVDAGEPTYDVPGVGSVPTQTIIYHYPRGSVLRLPQRDPQEQYINNYFRSFVTNLASAGFNTSTGYVQYIEVDSWIDYLITAVVAMNTDALRWSTFFYKDRNRRIEMGPVWDCDRCMGSTDGRNFAPRTWAGGGTDYFNWSWWGRLFNDPNFFQRFIDRYQEVRQAAYSETNLFAIIDGFAAELREAYPREFARWRVSPRGTNGTGAGTFATEVQWKKNWFAARLNFMDTNFLSRVAFDRAGGLVATGARVTLTPPNRVGGMTSGSTNSVVYYTLDGTDPREPGGGVTPGAWSNLGPVTITISNNVRIFARAFNPAHRNLRGSGNPPRSSSWSGPTEATFYVSTPPLRITEIMYHPPAPVTGDPDAAEEFEYIEVKNLGHAPLSLHRFRLWGGVDFAFPNEMLAAGELAVIVKNVSAFRSRYGDRARILGAYSSRLGNSGDHLVLEGGVREPILDFHYRDDWYPVTDGAGFSLQIVEETAEPANWSLKQSWRPSGPEDGTPGAQDPGAPEIPPVVVNEALTHTAFPELDSIELFNPTDRPANISHWWLTDDSREPRKYRIPPTTILPPRSYVSFTEAHFNSGPRSFALSAKGDEIYLFSGGADGRLTGYRHGFSFGAQASGVTFGRYVVSTGEDHFTRQLAPTLGRENTGPRVGPIVVTEIHYHPPEVQIPVSMTDNGRDEYIELQNISSDPLPLHDTTNPRNTWRLRDAIEFRFPPGVVLAANELVLVVGFDPAHDSQLSGFRTRLNVAESVRIFGPWEGRLDNSSAQVELAQPEVLVPGPELVVAYVAIDQVKYAAVPPWPTTADGTGGSLHRKAANGYGNDPANWTAAAPSPGLPYSDVGVPFIVGHPQSQTSMAYERVILSVVAGGPGPLSYQWRLNGRPIIGATESTLRLHSASPSQAGTYDVIVLNQSGAVASAPAVLTLRIPLQFTVQPQSLTVEAGTNVSFNAEVISHHPPVRYQWFHQGNVIPGATNATYVIDRVGAAQQGSYFVVVSDGLGPSTSAVANLLIVTSPWIVVQPLSYQETPFGGTATLSVTVTNTANLPIGYRWRRAGISIPGAFQVLHDYTSILTLTNVTNLNPLTYQVLVTNVANRLGILSATATNVAIADTDRDGIPDSVETRWGLNPNDGSDAMADRDGDTMTAVEEYIAGTDPWDASSYFRANRIILTGSTLIEFTAVSNRTYTLQFTADIDQGSWTNLTSASAHSTNRVVSLRDSAPGATRFYRLVTPAQP
jgi:hypothetical protein